MSNPLSKKALSCKRWGKYTITRNLWFLAMLWYTAFQFFILTGGNDVIETYNQSIFHQYSGLISLAEIIIIVVVRLCLLIWIIKTYNLLLKYKPDNKFFVKKGWLAGVLRCIPIVCLYTKYRILKDLYFNLTEEKNRKKGTFYTRYTFYLLAWGFFIIYGFVSGMFDANLLDMVKINSVITSLLATVAIPAFNNIIGAIGNFCDTFNIVKGVTKKDENESKEKEDKIEKMGVTEVVKGEGIKTKKFNYKKLLSIIFIIVIAGLVILLFASFVGKNNSSKETTKHVTTTSKVEKKNTENKISISDQEVFENTLKCHELKNEFIEDMNKFFESHAHEYEYITHDHQTIWIPLVSAEKNHVEIFYSPITNSCIGTIRDSNSRRDKGVGQTLYVIMDLFNSNKVIIDSQDIYDEKELLVGILLSAKSGLPEYNEEDFGYYQFDGDEAFDNIGLADEIFRNEVNYLKGK